MDLTKLQKDRLQSNRSLAEQLQLRREPWLAHLRSRHTWNAGSNLSRVKSFTAERFRRWREFPILLHGDQASYPRYPLKMDFFSLLETFLPLSTTNHFKQDISWGKNTLGEGQSYKGIRSQNQAQDLTFDSWPTVIAGIKSIPAGTLLLPPKLRSQTQSLGTEPALNLHRGESANSSVAIHRTHTSGFLLLKQLQDRSQQILSVPLKRAKQEQTTEAPSLMRTSRILRLTSGESMPSVLRSRLEQLMGFNLGHVQLHTDSTAASLAFQLRANAFTLGSDIFFAANKFQPHTRSGLGLLVHELTHVRQQPEGAPLRWGNLTLTQYRTLEQEAQAQERAVLAGIDPPALRKNYGGFQFASGKKEGLSGQASLPHTTTDVLPTVVLSYPSRPTVVTPLRQDVTETSEMLASTAGAPPAVTPATVASEMPDPEQLAQQVYERIQRRLRIERERGGIQRWL